MFRLTRFIQDLVEWSSDAAPIRRESSGISQMGPVVVWNLLRRCNLSCQHCYTSSADKAFSGELSTPEILRILEELKDAGVRAVILSGGEPLLHREFFTIAHRAIELGFYLALSTNGTLIDAETALRLQSLSLDYVGVSIDGQPENHDRIRGEKGAFEASMNGIRHCLALGIRVGLRFTPSQENVGDLPELLQRMDEEGVERIYLSHLNYAGRGGIFREKDSKFLATRNMMENLFEFCWQEVQTGGRREVVTGNNDADGVFFLFWVRRHHPEKSRKAKEILTRWGGNASGIRTANIDNQGHLHPDIFWRHHDLGDLRHASFSTLWHNDQEPMLAALRQHPRPVKGRCAICAYLEICGGNTRVRAYQLTGDIWAEDPGCYLTDEEVFSQ